MLNQCNFAGYIVTDPKQVSDKLIGVTLKQKKTYNGQETITWINISIVTSKATWLNGLQKGDYVICNGCEYQVKKSNDKEYPSFFAFSAESPTLQARNNDGGGQPHGQPQYGSQGREEYIEDDIPF